MWLRWRRSWFSSCRQTGSGRRRACMCPQLPVTFRVTKLPVTLRVTKLPVTLRVTSTPAEASDRRAVGARGRSQRQQHDEEIQNGRAIFEVIQIVFEIAQRVLGIAGPAMNPRPAGDAGLDAMAQRVERDYFVHAAGEERALRAGTHDRHLSLENVE